MVNLMADAANGCWLKLLVPDQFRQQGPRKILLPRFRCGPGDTARARQQVAAKYIDGCCCPR